MSDQVRDGLKVYTKEEAAAILRVKVSWLERRAAARQIPFTMLSGAYRFTDTHLAEIVAMNEQGTLPPPPTPITRRRQRSRADARKRPDGFTPLRPRPKASA
ncbi:MerR family transcriptional regulator [Actinomadura rudentiformis]|uniref:hypothetical protein n=1 Tax=Actinomadura rudentiformis TaxID=359158 RepID=UPI00178C7C08|nr:hypothetical protein [Actinomadura rudentiformis]